MNENQITYPIEDRWTYLWLILGIVLSLFSVPIGNYTIPLVFWIGSVFFIRFMRTQRRWWLAALIVAAATFLTAYLALPAWLGPIRIASAVGVDPGQVNRRHRRHGAPQPASCSSRR